MLPILLPAGSGKVSRRPRSRLAIGALALLAPPLASCRGAADTSGARGAVVRDDFGDSIVVSERVPHRIVSLNPATTAMLFAIGQGPHVVGRSRWDNYPAAALAVANVGDALRPNVEAILAVHPDLVVLYANADDRDAARQLRAADVPTLSIRDDEVADFGRVLRLLGLVVHDTVRAQGVADSVEATLARVRNVARRSQAVPVVWIVDLAPLRAIGGGSFLSELLVDAGGENLYAAHPDPAPQVSLEDVLQRNPDLVLTSVSAAGELRRDPRWRHWLAVPGHRVLVPDSALVGTPSVRMGEAALDLARLLHPRLAW